MTPIEEAIRKILPVDKWRKISFEVDTIARLKYRECADELESLIPALVEMVNAALAQRTREAADRVLKYVINPYDEQKSGREQFADAILALIKPDESAALAERDRRVRLEEAEWWHANSMEEHYTHHFVECKRVAALRGTGEEKQP